MKKTFDIEVDCANCANLMEVAAKKVVGVQDVIINFMTQKMIVEIKDNEDFTNIMKNIKAECKKIDSDFEIKI